AGAAGAACGAAATACDDRTAGLAGVVPRARSAASNGAVVTAGDVGRGGTARRPSVNEAGGFALCSTAGAGPNPGLTAPPSASAAGLAHAETTAVGTGGVAGSSASSAAAVV